MQQRAAVRVARQPDILEWANAQKAALTAVRNLRRSEQDGFVSYGKKAVAFFVDMRANREKRKKEKLEEEKKNAAKPVPRDDAVMQYYQSQDLLKRMKWKRVQWEADADYESFARRVTDNDALFAKCPAFSFMSLTVVADTASPANAGAAAAAEKARLEDPTAPVAITDWFCHERDPVELAPFYAPSKGRQAPYTIDWAAGEARILDSASPQEILTFLQTLAPRLQAVQVRMEEDQTKLTEDVEKARIRLGLTAIKYNQYDRSYWDDAARKKDANYVNPDHLRMFLDGSLQRATLLWLVLGGHQVRVVAPSAPYAIDTAKRELHIPANFSEFCYLRRHARYIMLERVINFQRRLWWVWFCLGMLIVGDLEVV